MWTKYIVAALLLASAVLCSSQMHSLDGNNETYPFLVSVRENLYFRCVGTVVAPKWVLTAASCAVVPHNSQLSVQYGVKKPIIMNLTELPVGRVYVFEGWSSQAPLAHNIALLEVGHRMGVAPVNLPSRDYLGEVEHPAFFTSWAVNMNTNELRNKAQKVPLMIQSNEECDRRLRGALSSCGNVCTRKVGTGHEDSCFAFGGPLLYGSTQVGIAVDNNGQDNCAVPSLYTKVHRYTPWIRSTIQKFTDLTSETPEDAPRIGIMKMNYWF